MGANEGRRSDAAFVRGVGIGIGLCWGSSVRDAVMVELGEGGRWIVGSGRVWRWVGGWVSAAGLMQGIAHLVLFVICYLLLENGQHQDGRLVVRAWVAGYW